MKTTLRPSHLLFATCSAGPLALVACGGAQGWVDPIRTPDTLAMALSFDPNGHHGDPNGRQGDPNGMPGDPNGHHGDPDARAATCERIGHLLERDRAVLEATPEWQAVTQTDAWATFSGDIQAFHAAECVPFDPQPTAECAALTAQMHQDFEALEHTHEYRAVAQTIEFRLVHDEYAALRQHGCWQLPSAQDPNNLNVW